MTKSPKTDTALPQSSSLPEGWHTVRFGDVAKKISDIVDRKNCDLDHFVAGEHMQTDDFRIKEWGTIDDGYLGPAFNHKFSKGQILYGSRRTYLRKVSLPHFDGVCANTTFVIEPTGDDLIPELLPFVMQSAGFNEQSIRMSKGSTNPYINWKDIACYEFAVPEKEEQRRIATTLWAAENCIVKGERFVAAAEQTKRVLMRELFSKGIGHTKFKSHDRFEKIPYDWGYTNLGEISQIDTGQSPDGETYNTSGIGVPLLNGPAEYGEIHPTPVQWTSNPTKICKNGDILICVRGSTTGRMNKADQEYCIGRGISAIRGVNNISDTSFLNYLLELLNDRIVHIASGGGSTFPNITKNQLHEFEVPYPPLPEQRQIAGILTRCDETIAAARANVAAAKALKMKMIKEMLSPGN
jgi:type I restriction enzyme, S subunit